MELALVEGGGLAGGATMVEGTSQYVLDLANQQLANLAQQGLQAAGNWAAKGMRDQLIQGLEHAFSSKRQRRRGRYHEGETSGGTGISNQGLMPGSGGSNGNQRTFSVGNYSPQNRKMPSKTKKGGKRISRKGRSRKPKIYASMRIAEQKFFDTPITTVTPQSTTLCTSTGVGGTLACLPAQGVDYNQRIGRKIRLLRVEVYCRFTGLTDVGNLNVSSDEIIMWLIKDKIPRGSEASAGEVFAAPPNNVTSGRNVNNLTRFKILGMHKHDIHAAADNAGVVTQLNVEPAFIRMVYPLNCVTEYTQGGTPVPADILTNTVFIAFCNVNGTTGMEYKMNLRYWYEDA